MKKSILHKKRKAIKKKSKQFWRYFINADQSVKVYLNPAKHLLAYWSSGQSVSTNWGDALNPWLINQVSKKTVFHLTNVINIGNMPVYVVIGSILHSINFKNAIVWGAGFMHATGSFRTIPKEILLVRGPLTRGLIIKSGIKCPENFGDPALLISQLYKPNVRKSYKIGIIPHHIDFHNPALKSINERDDINIIDIKSGIENVIDEANKCEIIASSSLHGLILADSYGIPNSWIKLSNLVLGKDFKFYDYYLSLNHHAIKPIEVGDKIDIRKIVKQASAKEIKIESILKSCPF